MVTMKLEVLQMIAIPELAMPKSRKVTTVCNGRLEVWADYEQTKAYFLEFMMSAEGEERERAECVYIQLLLQSLLLCTYDIWKCPTEPFDIAEQKLLTQKKTRKRLPSNLCLSACILIKIVV